MKELLPCQESYDTCIFETRRVKVIYQNPAPGKGNELLEVEGTMMDQMEDSVAVQINVRQVALIPKAKIKTLYVL